MGRGRGSAGRGNGGRPAAGTAAFMEFQDGTAATTFANENYAARLRGLPLAQREAFTSYTSELANVYSAIGDYLRKGATIPGWKRAVADEMDRAFGSANAALDHDVTMYRGFGSFYETVRNLPAGATFTDAAFVSASISPNLAWGSAPIATIRVPRGARAIYASPVAVNSAEAEFVLDRGTTFRIVTPATATRPPVLEVVAQRQR